jgi:hypothetical protein
MEYRPVSKLLDSRRHLQQIRVGFDRLRVGGILVKGGCVGIGVRGVRFGSISIFPAKPSEFASRHVFVERMYTHLP